MSSPNAAPGRTDRDRRRRLFLLVALVAGLLLLAGGAYLLFGGSTPDEVGTGDAALEGLDEAAASDDDSNTDDDASADGTWTVTTDLEPYDLAASTGSFVGYRIDEELANVGTTQAVGRTPAVDGQLTVDGTSVTGAEVTGDLTQLASDRSRRDGRVAEALAVAEEPTVRFVAEDVTLPAELLDGERIEVDVPGTLEAAGGSADVTAAVTAQRSGDVVVVTGSLQVALADLGISPPTAAMVLSVADTATIEWQLYLTR